MPCHKIFSTDIDIRFRDLDAMGHVNNAVFFTYFEYGRLEFFYSESQKGLFPEISFILAHIRCDYIKPITFKDKLTLQIWVSKIGGKSFKFQYKLMDSTDSSIIFATGESVQVSFDYQKNTSIPVSDELRAQLSAYLKKSTVD